MAQIGSEIRRINTVVTTSDRKMEDLQLNRERPVVSVPLIQGSNIEGDDLLHHTCSM